MVGRFYTAVAVLGAALFIVPGLWALFDPQGFYDELATFPPYNEHFIHDIGAFQIGIGAALLAALWRPKDALFAAFAGAAAGSAVHTLTHIMDHELGGNDSDVFVFGLATIILGAAAVMRFRLTPGGVVGTAARSIFRR